jgi:hypothetical protein
VSFTTIITYEVIKIWKALGTRALEAFFGIRKQADPKLRQPKMSN